MTRFFLLPGQNYTGPGNSTSRAYRRRHPPTDALDRASLQHDLRYQRLIERQGRLRTYTHFSGADAAYLRRIEHLPGWRAGLARGVFKVKAALAPAMPRSKRGRSSSSGAVSTPYVLRRGPRAQTGSGHYHGRLPRPAKTSRPGRVALFGHRAEAERYGTVDHPLVAYLGAQVAPAGNIGTSVGISFLRMVMKRHYQIEYSDPQQAIRPYGSGTSDGTSITNATNDYFPLGIKFWRKRTFGGASASLAPEYSAPVEYEFPAVGSSDATPAAFGRWFNQNVFMNILFQDEGTSPTPTADRGELHAYQFVHGDGAIDSALRRVNQAIMPLDGQYLTAYSVVRMHIQNVTPADGGDLSTDRVDVNPLKGKLFRFRGPTPMVRDDRGIDGTVANDLGWKLQNDTNGDGLIWPNIPLPGIPPVYQGPWVQTPTSDMFKNCVGCVSIQLDPGSIKDYSLNFKFSGTLQALMRGFDHSTFQSVPLPGAKHQFGQSFMFALEKRVQTGLSSSVKLNFQYETYYGSCFGKRRLTSMTRQAFRPELTVQTAQELAPPAPAS